MKTSSALTVFTLVAGVIAIGFGFRDRQRVASLHADHQKLIAAARSLGIAVNSAGRLIDPSRGKRPRDDRDETARRIAREVIALARVAPPEGETREEEEQRRLMLLAPLLDLNAAQLKIFIAEVSATNALEHEPVLQNLVGYAFVWLAELDPRSALALVTDSGEMIAPTVIGESHIASALSKLAGEDPVAALEWVKANSEKHPDLITENSKIGVLSALAAHDPDLAFQTLGELALPNTPETVIQILFGARTPKVRKMILARFRDHLGTMGDAKTQQTAVNQIFRQLARSVSERGFAAAAGWTEELTPGEAEAFAAGISHNRTKDVDQWIEWSARTLSEANMHNVVRELMSDWARNDLQAAGSWLAQAPDDDAKIPAVQAYAGTAAALDPHTATQWALALPPGEERQSTLRTIHNRWPATDAEGKAAFGKEYGVE